MRLGMDYQEVCSCGATLTMGNVLESSRGKLIYDWRQNHVCPNRHQAAAAPSPARLAISDQSQAQLVHKLSEPMRTR